MSVDASTLTAHSDPPVRSVRVAMALTERFRELVSGPATGNPQDMSIRIGEAQQLFPEIWTHLDEARKGFAARGRDCAAYDAIRVHEQGVLGVTNLDLVTVGYGRNEHQIRVAEFNTGGYQRAREAAGALMRAVPEVDWGAIAQAEDAELASIGSLTNGKWIALAIAIPLLLGLMYFLMHKR
ncbi:MAG: hypothetical protein NT062_22495 [Proteobacteria bacterium]|nr:hypothetical protein [Pseudomonadota bacterium]